MLTYLPFCGRWKHVSLAAAKKQETTDQNEDHAMFTSFKDAAVQLIATLSLTAVLGAALYIAADFATQGVIA